MQPHKPLDLLLTGVKVCTCCKGPQVFCYLQPLFSQALRAAGHLGCFLWLGLHTRAAHSRIAKWRAYSLISSLSLWGLLLSVISPLFFFPKPLCDLSGSSVLRHAHVSDFPSDSTTCSIVLVPLTAKKQKLI